MPERNETSGWQSSTRGDSAWKEARERVAARNEAVSKSGKREREAFERERDTARRSAEARRHAELVNRRTL
jgi:hypothetical protein